MFGFLKTPEPEVREVVKLVDTHGIIQDIEKKLEILSSHNTVIQLTESNVSDYERGRIRGRIESLQSLLRDLAGRDENNIV